MRKKILIAVTALMLSLAFVFAGCSKFDDIQKAYKNADRAVTIVKTIEIQNSGVVINRIEETYELREQDYFLTVKTFSMNAVGQENTEITTTETIAKDELDFGALPGEDSFSALEYSEEDGATIVIGTMKAEALENLNLEAANLKGGAKIRMIVESKTFRSMTIEYETTNENQVKIAYQYQY